MMMPLGTYTIAMRTGALGAADMAGAMASRNGSATAAPTPCKKVLRPSALRSMGVIFEVSCLSRDRAT